MDCFAERQREIRTRYELNAAKTQFSCHGNFPSAQFVTSAKLKGGQAVEEELHCFVFTLHFKPDCYYKTL